MPSLPTSPTPTYQVLREPGERHRLVTVRHTEDLFVQQKKWLIPHRNNYYLLMLLTKGSGRYWVDRVPYQFSANMLFFTTPQHVQVKEDVQTAGTVVCITPDFFALAANADLLALPFIQFPPAGQALRLLPGDILELQELCGHLVREYEQPAELQDELLYAYLRVLLLSLSRLYYRQYDRTTPGAPQPSLYHRLQASIEAHYKTLRDVPAYAELLNLSANHLTTLVREQSGKTVLQHVHERQLLEAKRLLYTTELSVKEIAFELGFQDASYFNRFFKRLVGMSPLAYRAAHE